MTNGAAATQAKRISINSIPESTARRTELANHAGMQSAATDNY